MNRDIKAIPTKYRGIQMRSRLEATWAAVFDGFGWDWDYEPCIDFPKCESGPWIPDFKLTCKKGIFRDEPHKPILVEVKAADSIEGLANIADIYRAYENSFKAGYDLLCVGPKPNGAGKLMLPIGIYMPGCENHASFDYEGFDPFCVDYSDALLVWSPGGPLSRINADIIVSHYDIDIIEPRLSGIPLSEYIGLNEPAHAIFEQV